MCGGSEFQAERLKWENTWSSTFCFRNSLADDQDAGAPWSFEELNSIASVLSSFSRSLLSVIQSLMSDMQSWTLKRSGLCQMVVRIYEAENHQQKVDTPCSGFVISEKVVECTEQTKWAQGLNLEALQTEGQLGQTECWLERWSERYNMTETSWEQNQKYQSSFGDNLKECGGQSCQIQLMGLIVIRSEQKLCHSQRLQGGHWAHREVPSPCYGKQTEKCMWICSCWDVLLIEKGQLFPAKKGQVQDRAVVFKLTGIMFVLFIINFFSKGFPKEVLNSEGKVADCREMFIKYVK